MNKYLLLRDNKQSGPYTVPEIIEKGIKPYDLVWLEGKSAAWRYPSEVDELKDYAPAVEEQPYDRFYKKPDKSASTGNTISTIAAAPVAAPVKATHSPYEPKVAAEAVTEESVQSKKVYINFPAGGSSPKKTVIPETKKEIAVINTNNIPETITEKPSNKQPERDCASEVPASTSLTSFSAIKTPSNVRVTHKEQSDRKFIYVTAAACLVLIGTIAILLVNNSNQQERLKELNSLVKQIENRNSDNSTRLATAAKSDDLPSNNQSAPEQTSETIVNPELLADNDHNAPPSSAENVPATINPSPSSKKTAKATDEVSGIVYTEKPLPKEAETSPGKPSATVKPSAPSSENLFKLVSVKSNKYKTGVLGGISNLQLELTNNSARELYKVAVEIKYLGPEKKIVNTQTVYFENVSPGSQTTLDVPKSKRGVSIDYTIIDIKS